ncbi:putative odorant receptor 92a [Diprion similis]|uniref:putative odorant receptor 92a n=1 Tax=Diprion similis TaxID=362088 RepID=UPI001EF842D4|nr:putative odorant receptor 92a [Diprion similis]XP_046749414.1 putative odorant receptor 92a [Diprion similis]
MKYKVTIGTAIAATKYLSIPIWCWPPPVQASKWVVRRHNICGWVALVHLLLSTFSMIYNMYLNRSDIDRCIKVLADTVALVSACLRILICKKERLRLQVLLAEMEKFVRQATGKEEELIQAYVDRCLVLHTTVFVSCIAGPIFFIAGPIFLPQPFPGDFAYPFEVKSTWLWLCLYIMQSICVLQVGSMIMVDILYAMLLWYAGLRFELLNLELQKITNMDELRSCVESHQKLIRYTDKLTASTRFMAAEISSVAMFAITTAGFVIIRRPSTYDLVKYVFFETASATELLLFSWPADHLLKVSEGVGASVFNSHWIGKSPTMLRNILSIMQRSQQPALIYVDGLVPVLSLAFYGSTISASFSYLTTLCALVGD